MPTLLYIHIISHNQEVFSTDFQLFSCINQIFIYMCHSSVRTKYIFIPSVNLLQIKC